MKALSRWDVHHQTSIIRPAAAVTHSGPQHKGTASCSALLPQFPPPASTVCGVEMAAVWGSPSGVTDSPTVLWAGMKPTVVLLCFSCSSLTRSPPHAVHSDIVTM